MGTKTISCDNANATKPFGTIDTPAQGGVVSGSAYRVWDWVLAHQPKMIPLDGSTLTLWLDGIAIGNVTYGFARADIQSLFPDYKNTDTAVWYFDLDTTLYPNGVHSIALVAVDDAGAGDGIGSRFFTIQN